MAIEVTKEAIEVLRRSLEMGKVDPGRGGVRLRAARGLAGGLDVQVELAEGPLEGEITVDADDVRLFVDPGITEGLGDAVVGVEPQHERIVVRPKDSR